MANYQEVTGLFELKLFPGYLKEGLFNRFTNLYPGKENKIILGPDARLF